MFLVSLQDERMFHRAKTYKELRSKKTWADLLWSCRHMYRLLNSLQSDRRKQRASPVTLQPADKERIDNHQGYSLLTPVVTPLLNLTTQLSRDCFWQNAAYLSLITLFYFVLSIRYLTEALDTVGAVEIRFVSFIYLILFFTLIAYSSQIWMFSLLKMHKLYCQSMMLHVFPEQCLKQRSENWQ